MIKNISNTEALISKIIGGIEEVKGDEINLLDLREIKNSVCSYFIICNGTSNTHVNAIVNSIQKTVSKTLKEKKDYTKKNNNNEKQQLIILLILTIILIFANLFIFLILKNSTY